jgi:hypothetical protein
MTLLTELRRIAYLALLIALGIIVGSMAATRAADFAATPVLDWSTEARRAIVPVSAGPENYGNKFPGEAALYMGIVHVAIYDAAVAIEGGYEPYAIALTAPPNTSSAAAIATAAHHTLVGCPDCNPPHSGLQPPLGLTPEQQAILDGDYAAYMAAIPDGTAKTNGIAIGEQVAAAVVALRTNDGRERNPTLEELHPPPPGPGIWEPNAGDPPPPVLGLRLPGITPLALESAAQLRPDGPNELIDEDYAHDFNQVKELGAVDSTTRTPEQTTQALFWTDHDIRQWNDGMLNLAVARGLDLVQTARMLAMAHVAGGDGMIACFDAKYHYWFWRPIAAIHEADIDGNPNTEADPTWLPMLTTPNFPEYPSAHASNTTAVAQALHAFFGTDYVAFSLDSRVTNTTREYQRFRDVVKDVSQARVLVGFHFRNSDQEGSEVGRGVGRYVATHYFQPVRCHR